jgi:adhesin transport system membrane fusion protein
MNFGRLTPYLIMLGLVLIVFWVNLVSIEISAQAPGKVIPTGKVRVLQNLEGGIIKKIYVAKGQIVEAGDVLVEFEEVSSKSEVSEIEARLAFLRSDILIHKSILEGSKPSFSTEDSKTFPKIVDASRQQFYALQQVLDSELAVLKGGVEKNQKSIKITREKLVERKEMASILERQIQISEDLLVEQLTSEIEHLDLLRAKQNIRAQVRDALQATHELESGIRQFELEIERTKQLFKEEISSKLQLQIEEEQKYSSRLERFADALDRRFVTSPVNGTIKKLYTQTIGGVVKPGVDLLEVVPLSEKLIVEARLPVEDIGFVSTGQPVLLRLSGAHSQYFSPIPGSVKIISPDSEKNELGEVFYIVQIETQLTEFVSGNKRFLLYPGMALDCSIVIGKRSLLENIIAPFMRVTDEAFRENVWPNVTGTNWFGHFFSIINFKAW